MNRTAPEIKSCKVCSIAIKAVGSSERRHSKVFCSRKCRGLYQTEQGVLVSNCHTCSKEIRISGSRKKKNFQHQFCSFYCYGLSKRTPNFNPSEAVKLRKSWAYTQWRKAIYERDDYTCQFCGERGVELNADHIKPFARFPELRLSLDNGRTLCVICHRKTPTYGGRTNKI